MKTHSYAETRSIRQKILDAARSIFEAEGLAGLSVRRVAQRADCTTMVIYSRFGGKEGLLAALFDEGFAQLAHAQAAVTQADPWQRVLEMCLAYCQTARAFPHHYALMLGSFSGAFVPPPESQAQALKTFQTLQQAVQTCAPAASASQVEAVAEQLFAFCHGWVSLENHRLPGPTDQREQRFTRAIQQLLLGLQQPDISES